MIPTRKNCTHCGRWLLCCINFRVAERNPDDTPKRLQSWCNECKNESSRILNGRKRRGARYNKNRHLPDSQLRTRRLTRYHKRQTAKRRGDPYVPLEPLAQWLKARISESSAAEVALLLRLDREHTKRLANQIVISTKTGRVERQLDIRLSRAEQILLKFETPLMSVYSPDDYPWLYEGRRPRKRPRKPPHAA